MKVAAADNRRYVSLYGKKIDFDSDVWELPNPTPATHKKLSTIDWRVDVDSSAKLTDPNHKSLRDELKEFLESLINNCQEGRAPAPSTAGHVGQGLGVLAKWMIARRMVSLSEIDNEASWDFVDYVAGRNDELTWESDDDLSDLEDDLPDNGDRVAVRFSTAIRCFNVLALIYRQRRALDRIGVPCIKEKPFDGRTPHSVVTQDLGLARNGRLLPIPDDVAIPILNAAIRLIGQPADDVIDLSSLHAPLRTEKVMKGDRVVAYDRYREGLRAFKFSTIPGESSPWHGDITGAYRTTIDGRRFYVKETQRVRRLVMAIVTACATTIQGLTGIRAHELIGAKVERPTSIGLPSMVSVELSRDKTTELFYFNGETCKGRRRKAKWLLGSRLAGSSYEPPPVRAFRVLVDLLAPWRELAGSNDLLPTFIPAQGLPRKPASIGKMTSGTLSVLMKEFVAEHVDLSKATIESREEFLTRNAIRGHRWRPTFALYLYRVSPDLLPAISDHFKHMNVSITLDGYIGNDPSLIEFCNSAKVLTSAEFLLEVTAPGAKVAGGSARMISEIAPEVRTLIEKEKGDSLLERALTFVESRELFIYNAAYAHCLISIRPNASRCNQMAGGADWRKPFPNDTYRSVGVCLGCELLALTPKHASFFAERAERNDELEQASLAEGSSGVAKIAAARARQSRLILKKLQSVQ